MKIGILFDLDGTLLDTLADLTDATNYALACHGYPPHSKEAVRGFVGNGAQRLIAAAVPEGQDFRPVFETFRVYYRDHCQVKTRPYEGILEALAKIREKYPVAIVSNKPDFAVKPLCRDYFGDIYALGETPDCPRKPAPDMVYKAMAAIGADRCVYVGDSDVDVLTAQNAGALCLSVLWGFRDQPCIQAAGGQHFCQAPQAMPEALDALAQILKI